MLKNKIDDRFCEWRQWKTTYRIPLPQNVLFWIIFDLWWMWNQCTVIDVMLTQIHLYSPRQQQCCRVSNSNTMIMHILVSFSGFEVFVLITAIIKNNKETDKTYNLKWYPVTLAAACRRARVSSILLRWSFVCFRMHV